MGAVQKMKCPLGEDMDRTTNLTRLFFLQICGLALIVVGVLVQMALHSTVMIKDASASAIPLVLIIVGVVIFFIAFFGCCGAWKENYCMITMVIHKIWSPQKTKKGFNSLCYVKCYCATLRGSGEGKGC